MEFSQLLNRYIDEIGCSAKDLASTSGISAAAISRYRAGERTPDPDSKQLRMLAGGIAALSNGAFGEQDVLEALASAISGISVDYGTFTANLASLMTALSISNNELARALSFDPSYISRILAGQRRPADLQSFIAGISQLAVRRCSQREDAAGAMRNLIGSTWTSASSDAEREQAVSHWIATNYTPPQRNSVSGFLEKLDAFDLDDFIRAIHFDDIKVPTAPLQLPTTKTYTGIREMMACELDFLKAAVLSKSSASIILYSDMPFEEMAADGEFSKKWMLGVAMLMKKGLHLHIVHETNRPLAEMMLGLEGWIPLYMTGQISPYYFDGPRDGVFSHIIRSAGTVALQGEAIVGHQGEGRYVLTKSRDEVRYYRRRAERMLEKARPLMHIITTAERAKLAAFLDEDLKATGPRRVIMSTLPIGSIPPDLLDRMLERNGVKADEREAITAFARQQAARFATLLETCEMRLEIGSPASDEFASHPPVLDLSALFYTGEIAYTPEEYAEHFDALRTMAAQHPSCALVVDTNPPFRNIQISMCGGRVLVSKAKGPVIHFVIEHPAMVEAFERFTAPVSE